MSPGDWIGFGTLICVVIGGAWGVWRASKADDRATEDRQRQAVESAVATITADRDYWRTRADEFEKELRQRGD